ncbi:MAG: Glycerophosphoryl diester phosphodiesterase, partial [uncultured Rubrobacteraceae bacterium]
EAPQPPNGGTNKALYRPDGRRGRLARRRLLRVRGGRGHRRGPHGGTGRERRPPGHGGAGAGAHHRLLRPGARGRGRLHRTGPQDDQRRRAGRPARRGSRPHDPGPGGELHRARRREDPGAGQDLRRGQLLQRTLPRVRPRRVRGAEDPDARGGVPPLRHGDQLLHRDPQRRRPSGQPRRRRQLRHGGGAAAVDGRVQLARDRGRELAGPHPILRPRQPGGDPRRGSFAAAGPALLGRGDRGDPKGGPRSGRGLRGRDRPLYGRRGPRARRVGARPVPGRPPLHPRGGARHARADRPRGGRHVHGLPEPSGGGARRGGCGRQPRGHRVRGGVTGLPVRDRDGGAGHRRCLAPAAGRARRAAPEPRAPSGHGATRL